MKQDEKNEKKPTMKQVIMSVLASMFGVQKGANRERDFTHGDPKVFIITGIIIVTLFVLLLVILVHVIMWFAGA